VFWDGTPGDHTTVNPTGLGGVNLTAEGIQDSFAVVIPVTDIPAELTIAVSAFTPVPGFDATDFTNVGAVTFETEKDPYPFYTRRGRNRRESRVQHAARRMLKAAEQPRINECRLNLTGYAGI
jgi:hypothetical protein